MIKQDLLSYFQTLSAELDVQQNRIRQLIGDRHWLSDGTHKESLLAGLLTRHLPATVTVTKGFVIRAENRDVSREQDILAVATDQEMPLFCQGGLSVVSASTVLASVTVKSAANKKSVSDAIATLLSIPVAGASSQCWRGAYFFDDERPTGGYESLSKLVARWIDELSEDWLEVGDIFLRIGPDLFLQVDGPGRRVLGYNCTGTATAFFVANLLNEISARRGDTVSFFSQVLDRTTGDNVPCVVALGSP